jgi:hypothetical protein
MHTEKKRLLCACVFLVTASAVDPSILGHIFSEKGKITTSVILLYIRWFQFNSIMAAFVTIVKECALRRCIGVFLRLGFSLLLLEVLSIFAYRAIYHRYHFHEADRIVQAFVRHPYLVGVPAPGVFMGKGGVTISHSIDHKRNIPTPIETNTLPCLVTVGGSTTYCTGVNDNQTWPYYLNRELSARCRVVNFGVPGYSTAEHIIQTALIIPESHPIVAIYYCGWNDARNMYIKDLPTDYSSYHGLSQYASLNLPHIWNGPDLCFVRLAIMALQKINLLVKEPDQLVVTQEDRSTNAVARALSIYQDNIKSITALCRSKNIEPIFVPQVMNKLQLVAHSHYGWFPYVRDDEVMAVIKQYNEALRTSADRMSADFVSEVLNADWKDDDFVDHGHFSANGNLKFAAILVPHITNVLNRVRTNGFE